MPFTSKAQQRYLFATHPAMAKEWAAHTPSIASLPEHVGDKKKKHKKQAETLSDILSEIFSETSAKAAMLSLGGSLTSAASSPSPSDSSAPSHASQGQPGAQSDKARSFFPSVTPSRGSPGVNPGKTDKRITSLFGYIPGSSPHPKQKQAEDGEAGGVLSGLGGFPVSNLTSQNLNEKLAGRFDGLLGRWRMPAHLPAMTPHTPVPRAPSVPLVPHTPPTAHLPSTPATPGHVPPAPTPAAAHTPTPATPEVPAGAGAGGGRVPEVPASAPSSAPPPSPSPPPSSPAPLPHATGEIPVATHATSPTPSPAPSTIAPMAAPTPTGATSHPGMGVTPTFEQSVQPWRASTQHVGSEPITSGVTHPTAAHASSPPAPTSASSPAPTSTSPPTSSLPGGWDWFTHPLGTAAQRYLPEASMSLPGAAMGVARGAAHTGDFLINLLTGKGSTQNMVQGVNQSLRGNGQPSLSNYLRGFGYGAAGVGLPLFGAASRGEPPDLSEAGLAGMSANATGLRLPWDTLHGLHSMLPEHLQVPPDSEVASIFRTSPNSRHANPFAATAANARDFMSVSEAAPGAMTSEVRRAQIQHGLGVMPRALSLFGRLGGGVSSPEVTERHWQEDQAYRTQMNQMADRILSDPNSDPAERRRAMPYASRPGMPGSLPGIQGGAGPQGAPTQPQGGVQGGGEPSVPPEVAQRQQSISAGVQALRQGNLHPEQRQAIQNQLHQEIVSLAMPNIAAQTAQSAGEILNDITSGTGVVTAVGLTNLSQNLHDMGFRNAPQQAQGLWQGMNDAQKWALVAGLGIAAAGLFSAFQGHGGMGALLGLGGLGAAAYGLTGGQPFSGQAWGNVFRGQSPNPQRPGPLQLVPGAGTLGQAISRIGPKPQDPFGTGVKSPAPSPASATTPASAPSSPPPVSSSPTPTPPSSSPSPPAPPSLQQQVQLAQQAFTSGNTQQGVQMATQMFRNLPGGMEAFQQLDEAFSHPLAPGDAYLSQRSGGRLTPQDVGMLRTNWASIRAAMGAH